MTKKTFLTILSFKKVYPFKKHFNDNKPYLEVDNNKGYWDIQDIIDIKEKILKCESDEEIREVLFWTSPELYPYIIKLLKNQIKEEEF